MRSSRADGPARRLDVTLVERGLARSRGHARDLIERGAVRVDGRVVTRPSTLIDAGPPAAVVVASEDVWVGRAAYKLLAAFEEFGPLGLDAASARCLDVGASTGGFTQVLLARGATSVLALDVGSGQLVGALAADPRVSERSGTNIRHVTPGALGDPFDLVVADLSFISLRLVLGVIRGQLAERGTAVLLVKPQFEVGRRRVGKDGVVRDAAARADAVLGVVREAARQGLYVRALRESPLPGGTGNIEYLGWFTTDASEALSTSEVERLVATLDVKDGR